jgi:predicted DCC family thiol-disulfide oxidoreductase YuxK
LLYEKACPLCKLEVDNLKVRNSRDMLRFADVSASGFDPTPYGVPMSDLLDAIHATTADGRLVKGVEVFRFAYGAVGLGWLTAPLAYIAAHRAVRRNRRCKEGRCEV